MRCILRIDLRFFNKSENYRWKIRKFADIIDCMKKIFNIIALAVFLLIAVSCVYKQEKGPNIVTVSILPQKYFVEKIVGDKYNVKCMLSNGGNPETYEPSMANMMTLEKSDAYFFMGNLGFETAMRGKIVEYNPNIRCYSVSDGIELIKDTHGHGDFDPHTWTSVKNVKVISRNILKAMCELDPDNKDYYEKNYNEFNKELTELEVKLDSLLVKAKGGAFVVWHPSLSYFAKDYDLEQISLESHGKESPIKHIEKTVEYAKSKGAKVFFMQKDTDSSQANAVNKEIGAEVVSINPLSYEWKQEIEIIANALSR